MLLSTDDLVNQLFRLALENWPFLLISVVGLFFDKRGSIGKLLKSMAKQTVRTRDETGEHKSVNGNGNGVALRMAAVSIEQLAISVETVRQSQDDIRQAFLDFQQQVLAAVGAANTYTDSQIKALEKRRDTRLTNLTDEIRQMLDERLPKAGM